MSSSCRRPRPSRARSRCWSWRRRATGRSITAPGAGRGWRCWRGARWSRSAPACRASRRGTRRAGSRRTWTACGWCPCTYPTAARPTARSTRTSSASWTPWRSGWACWRADRWWWPATSTSARPTSTCTTPRRSRAPLTSLPPSGRASSFSSTPAWWTRSGRSTPASRGFTWWDYRQGHFHRDKGLRIDAILLSRPLADDLIECGIDRDFRKGPRPSDHAPLLCTVAL